MKRAVFHPAAGEEFLRAIEFYALIDRDLGNRFEAEIQRITEKICRHPDRFSRFHPPAQRALSAEFPYSIVYLDQPDRVWIVAVMHAKRRPGYWIERIE